MPRARQHTYYVYIATNRSGTLHTGVTNDLERRMAEHRERVAHGFTSRYRVDRLIWFEKTSDVYAAISREKQIKGWRRERKMGLIDSVNPKWLSLL